MKNNRGIEIERSDCWAAIYIRPNKALKVPKTSKKNSFFQEKISKLRTKSTKSNLLFDMTTLHQEILAQIKAMAKNSPYTKDASEKDPTYRAYGLRAPQVKALIASFKSKFKTLSTEEILELTNLLVKGAGEEQSVAIHLMGQNVAYYTPEHFHLLDEYLSHFCGWSKIDDICIRVLQTIFLKHPDEFYKQLQKWAKDEAYWKRRTSVVVFVRKVGKSGEFTDWALNLCDQLIWDEHDLVRKGVGWCLKDVMRGDKKKVVNYVKKLRKKGVSAVITLYAIRDLKGEERQAVLKV